MSIQVDHLNLLASRSHSSRVKMSPCVNEGSGYTCMWWYLIWHNQWHRTCTRTHLTDRALHVSDDRTGGIVKKFYSNLGHVSGVSSLTQNFVHLRKLHWYILRRNQNDIKVIINESIYTSTNLTYHFSSMLTLILSQFVSNGNAVAVVVQPAVRVQHLLQLFDEMAKLKISHLWRSKFHFAEKPCGALQLDHLATNISKRKGAAVFRRDWVLSTGKIYLSTW